MADFRAVAAWRALAEDRAGVEIAPEQAAAATRAATRAAILGKGDTWTRQAVEYEREMAAQHGGISRGRNEEHL